MGGAFISLALSRIMAKWLMGVKIIDLNTYDPKQRNIIQLVHHYARKSGLAILPQVGVYESSQVNAFATGPTRNRSLVAVSSGLMAQLDQDEIEGVIAHEISHIVNGDMVTMTLIQGIVNAFVIFFARIIAFSISAFVDERMRFTVHIVTIIVFEILFSVLGMVVVSWFSRWREYRADAGSSNLAGKDKMIKALRKIDLLTQKTMKPMKQRRSTSAQSIETLQISGLTRNKGGLLALLSTHPPIEKRIEAIKNNFY